VIIKKVVLLLKLKENKRMKKNLYIISAFLFIFNLSYGQGKSIKQSISEAFSKENISLLESQMGKTVYLDIEDSDGNYSVKQAGVILQNFINKNPKRTFKINHEGKSNDGARYIIATYSTDNKDYRVYLLISSKTASPKILQIEIEELLD
jgi:hypothetical protein